ncbi:hypothetical protein [Spirosoma areae]
MWYILINQNLLDIAQYRDLQQRASLTEVELFSEPYQNWCVFAVEKDDYANFMDVLDREGIVYTLTPDRPTRAEILADMQ